MHRQQCRLTLLGLVAFAKFELGDRHRAILAIPLYFLVLRESVVQDCQGSLDHCAVLASQLFAECVGDHSQSLRRVLDAIDQVVRIFALETLIKSKRLQAGETDQIGVLNPRSNVTRTRSQSSVYWSL